MTFLINFCIRAFWEVWFWALWPLAFLLDLFDTAIGWLGGGAPKMRTIQIAKYHWKSLLGHKIVDSHWECYNGYLYTEYVFDDGTKICIR